MLAYQEFIKKKFEQGNLNTSDLLELIEDVSLRYHSFHLDEGDKEMISLLGVKHPSLRFDREMFHALLLNVPGWIRSFLAQPPQKIPKTDLESSRGSSPRIGTVSSSPMAATAFPPATTTPPSSSVRPSTTLGDGHTSSQVKRATRPQNIGPQNTSPGLDKSFQEGGGTSYFSTYSEARSSTSSSAMGPRTPRRYSPKKTGSILALLNDKENDVSPFDYDQLSGKLSTLMSEKNLLLVRINELESHYSDQLATQSDIILSLRSSNEKLWREIHSSQRDLKDALRLEASHLAHVKQVSFCHVQPSHPMAPSYYLYIHVA